MILARDVTTPPFLSISLESAAVVVNVVLHKPKPPKKEKSERSVELACVLTLLAFSMFGLSLT